MWAEAGVVLVAHGPDTEAVRAHAENIAARRLFARVAFGLLRGAPSVEDAVAALDECPINYIVPFFMADGYFVREVIPRRLGLTGSLTRFGGREFAYCAPVGAHPALAGIVAARVRELCDAEGLSAKDVRVVVAGHGSARAPNSGETTRSLAASLEEAGLFGTVAAAFLEEPPLLAEAFETAGEAATVVAGLFAADGRHGDGDVRRIVDGAAGRVFYTGAIGPDLRLADLVLAQIKTFDFKR